MDEYRTTLAAAVDAACAGDLQALLVAQWMLSALRARLDTGCSDAMTSGIDVRA